MLTEDGGYLMEICQEEKAPSFDKYKTKVLTERRRMCRGLMEDEPSRGGLSVMCQNDFS